MRQLNAHMTELRTKQTNTQDLVGESCEAAVDSLKSAAAGLKSQLGSKLQEEINKQVKHSINR